MTVSREKLYEQVWAEPMTAVAKQYEVSSNYLARICERLGVPVPPRGYREKVRFGRGPPKPPLPQPAPGTELEWSRGYWTRPRRAPRAPVLPLPEPAARRGRIPVPDIHPLLVGARELFENARPNGILLAPLFLRPFSGKLPDIVVTREALPPALAAANALYLHLEGLGYPVTLAARGMFWRDDPEHGGKKRERFREEWSPCTPTVVHVRSVAFGLTLFETTKDVETVSVNGKSVPVDSLPPRRRRWYGVPTTTTVPSGLLALAAYSPYPDTSWHRVWRETSVGSLPRMVRTIQRELEASAPEVARLAAEADQRAEVEKRLEEEEQRQREEKERERERQEQERRRQQAAKESRDQLLAIVEAWALANRVEEFFRNLSSGLVTEPNEGNRHHLKSRADAARQMLGDTDALGQFKSWKTPEECLEGSAQRVGAF
ncbi:MAG TPA: hypothetical protein VMT17_01085 [Anaeromyxobacteraceae bacterium]|nr:hypothetical protein [Anaeromyxobacteraceae bacterium]